MAEIKSIKTDDFEIEYFSFGNGPRKMVIIPGMRLQKTVDSADFVVSGFDIFAKDFTVYLIDRKLGIDTDYSCEEMAEDTATVMKKLGIEDAYIFGTSQGGMIAQCIAINHPELVHALFLGSTLPRKNDVSYAYFDENMNVANTGDPVALNRYMFSKIYSPEYLKKYSKAFEMLENAGTPEEIKKIYYLAKACRDFDVYDRLNKIKAPTFVVGAKCDHVLGYVGSEEIASILGCDLYMYENGSHAIYDEDPEYRKRIFDFFMRL